MDIEVSHVWLKDHHIFESEAVACYGVHDGKGYVWAGYYPGFKMDAIGCYEDGEVYDSIDTNYPNEPVAWYENGKIWTDRYFHYDNQSLAYIDDEKDYVWKEQYYNTLTQTPIAHYDGNEGGALAALFLLGYLDDSDSASEEEEEDESERESESSFNSSYEYSSSESSSYTGAVGSSSGQGSTGDTGFLSFLGVMFVLLLLATSTKDNGTNSQENGQGQVYYRTQPRPYTSREEVVGSGPSTPPEYKNDVEPCCGEKWIALREVDLYESPPEVPEQSIDTLTKVGVVAEGEWVSTEQGKYMAKRGTAKVTEHTSLGVDAVFRPSFHPGELVYVYGSIDGDCSRTWIKQGFTILCGLQEQEYGLTALWHKVTKDNGLSGWVISTEKLVSRSGLNNSIESYLRTNADKPLPERLTEVDRLMALGADLNFVPLKHSTGVVGFGVWEGDMELLHSLFSRGLRVANGPTSQDVPCTAWDAAESAHKPQSVEMLTFLFEKGMRLDCLPVPALHHFLARGLSNSGADLTQLVRVVRLLEKHGASFAEKDRDGRALWPYLEFQGIKPERITEFNRLYAEPVTEEPAPAQPKTNPSSPVPAEGSVALGPV